MVDAGSLYFQYRLSECLLTLVFRLQLFNSCIEQGGCFPVVFFFCKMIQNLGRIQLAFFSLLIQKFCHRPVKTLCEISRAYVTADLIIQPVIIDHPGK